MYVKQFTFLYTAQSAPAEDSLPRSDSMARTPSHRSVTNKAPLSPHENVHPMDTLDLSPGGSYADAYKRKATYIDPVCLMTMVMK